MRWESQSVEAEDQGRLPGYRDAVIRRFDAPEALDTRFYEVRAKSALNRVHESSLVPFRWTVNPYRGCSHACIYCVGGDTPILMADGRTKPMAELRPGDRIYGTVREGAHRRYRATEVLAHWSTVKPAYKVTLEDGTELVASGDHRFLARRGWKFVTGTGQGPDRRPHLTTNDVLLGTGRFADGPDADADYRRGYVCGLVRGDGHLGTQHDTRDRGLSGVFQQFRPALADSEALDRCTAYLVDLDVGVERSALGSPVAGRRPMTAIRTQSLADVDAIRAHVRWPMDPSDGWRKGFLAGIFDAEGSSGGGEALRIASTDPAIIGWTTTSLALFGFRFVVERHAANPALQYVRLLGGLRERLRFLHLTDPAITRKRDIEGVALQAAGARRVASIEPLGEARRLYDITTGTGDFIANGIVSHNCFARPTHKYLDFDAGRDFEKEIVVKVNVPEVLRAELARPSWAGEHVALGTNTDPYQWVEGRYKLMPGIWEALRDAANPCSVLTKSPLLLRDLPLLKQIAEVAAVSANLSVPTLDEKAWRATEPHTPHPRARLEAVGELNRAGIPAGILIAPLIPGINDAPEQVERILALAAENGATGVTGIPLHLRGDVRGIFMDWLRSYRPDLVPRYEELYARGAYAPKEERQRLMRLVRTGAVPTWPSDLQDHRGARARGGRPAAERDRERERKRPPAAPEPAQQSLF